jgi:hypothetical protein
MTDAPGISAKERFLERLKTARIRNAENNYNPAKPDITSAARAEVVVKREFLLQPSVNGSDDGVDKRAVLVPSSFNVSQPDAENVYYLALKAQVKAQKKEIADRDEDIQDLRKQLVDSLLQEEELVSRQEQELAESRREADDLKQALADHQKGVDAKDEAASEKLLEVERLQRLLQDATEEFDSQKELTRQHRAEAKGHESAHERERKRAAIVEKALAECRLVADGHQKELARRKESSIQEEGGVAQELEGIQKVLLKSNNELAFQRDLAISRYDKAAAAEERVVILEQELAEVRATIDQDVPDDGAQHHLQELEKQIVRSREGQRQAEDRVQALEVESALGAAGLAASVSLEEEVEELMQEVATLQQQNQRLADEKIGLGEEIVRHKSALEDVSVRHRHLSESAKELAGRAEDAEVVAFALSNEIDTIHEKVPKAKAEAEAALAAHEAFEAQLAEQKEEALAEAEQAAHEQLAEQLEIKGRELESQLQDESQHSLDTAVELAAEHKQAWTEAKRKAEELQKELATVLQCRLHRLI